MSSGGAYVQHSCVHCGMEVFTNDGGRTWWDGPSGLTACVVGGTHWSPGLAPVLNEGKT